MSFEPNVGQARREVRFLAHGRGGLVEFTSAGLATRGVRLEFAGGNPNASIHGVARLAERHNYFSGAVARTDIPTFSRVRYSSIYPGVDVEFHGADGAIEYDFLIAPGADASRIRLNWRLAKRVRLDRDGGLIVEAPAGELRQRKPLAYQDSVRGRRMVAVDYALARGAVSFVIGAHDPDLPLIVDPVLFSTDGDAAPFSAMAVDAAGNIYLAGATESSSFDATSGSAQPSPGGGTCSEEVGTFPAYYFPCPDAFVIKLDPAGKVVYATYLGGNGNDAATAIAVDASGNAYIGGTTQPNLPNANTFPTTPGAAFTKPSATFGDAFIAKLNPSGNRLIYSTVVPGAGGSGKAALALDGQGEAYITGTAYVGPLESALPTTAGAFQPSSPNHFGVGAIAKLNASGSALVYATYLGARRQRWRGGDCGGCFGKRLYYGMDRLAGFPGDSGSFPYTAAN